MSFLMFFSSFLREILTAHRACHADVEPTLSTKLMENMLIVAWQDEYFFFRLKRLKTYRAVVLTLQVQAWVILYWFHPDEFPLSWRLDTATQKAADEQNEGRQGTQNHSKEVFYFCKWFENDEERPHGLDCWSCLWKRTQRNDEVEDECEWQYIEYVDDPSGQGQGLEVQGSDGDCQDAVVPLFSLLRHLLHHKACIIVGWANIFLQFCVIPQQSTLEFGMIQDDSDC